MAARAVRVGLAEVNVGEAIALVGVCWNEAGDVGFAQSECRSGRFQMPAGGLDVILGNGTVRE